MLQVGSNSLPHGDSGTRILPSCHLVTLLSSDTLSSGQGLFTTSGSTSGEGNSVDEAHLS